MSALKAKSADLESTLSTEGRPPEDESLPWKHTEGARRGDIVTAWERPEKGGVVYLRWTDPVTGRYAKKATGITIRDREGNRIQARISRAIKAAEAQLDEVRDQRRRLKAARADGERAGLSHEPTMGAAPHANVVAPVAEPPTARNTEIEHRTPRERVEMALEDGIAVAMRIGDGIFAADSAHARDTAKALRRALTVLPRRMPLSEFTPGTFRTLWRKLAAAYAHEAELLDARRRDARKARNQELLRELERLKPGGGLRATEMSVISLLHVTKWLNDEKRVDVGATRAPIKWRAALVADWTSTVPVAHQRPNRSVSVSHSYGEPGDVGSAGDREDPTRYTEEEAGRLLIALERADPRLRLGFELAGEGRLGPVARTRRSNLRLAEGAGVIGLGFFTVAGRGTKPGVEVHLDAEQRAVSDLSLAEGFLADLEAEYRAGILSDYWLFPGGRLVMGRARADADTRMDDRTLNDLWQQLEDLARVAHFASRGHYGYRRLATDIAEDLETDERVLNALFGHTPQGTRRRVYQQRGRAEVARKVTELRRRLRERFIGAAMAEGFTLADVPEPQPRKVPDKYRRGPRPRRTSAGARRGTADE